MLFCEPLFLFAFLPIALAIYYAVPATWKNIALTVISFIFYASGELHFIGWLTASVLLNYLVACGFQLGSQRTRKLLLFAGIISDLALLIVFKYGEFIVSNVNLLAPLFSLKAFGLPKNVLPLGISFFTFHKISYKVDVYRNPQGSRRRFSELCLYIMLFPQLLAGPIVRYHEIKDELQRRTHAPQVILSGMRRFVLGLTKKLFVANAAGLCADQIFGVPEQIVGVPLAQLSMGVAWFGAMTYALQIYFDFSGYSDMAIGLGQMLGFTFPENFNYPYIARSITEFWRRWHMSLSRWFRDYLYIPLGGNRAGPVRLYVNLLTVFLLCGLWHGASWNFVVWGLWHGLLLVAERLLMPALDTPVRKVIGHLYTLFAICVGWVFFRADDLSQAFSYLDVMLRFGAADEYGVYKQPLSWWMDGYTWLALTIGIVGCTPWYQPFIIDLNRWLQTARPIARWSVMGTQVVSCIGLLVFSVMIISTNAYSPFIYFRF